MPSRLFELLLKFILINDSRRQPTGYDKLYKVCPLLNILLQNFQSSYNPAQNLSINETMPFLQHMPKKPHKWAWVLADVAKGYVWNWKLYTGKEEQPPTSSVG